MALQRNFENGYPIRQFLGHDHGPRLLFLSVCGIFCLETFASKIVSFFSSISQPLSIYLPIVMSFVLIK